jgi:hypothetical protein
MDGALEALVDLKVFKTNLEANGAAEGTSSSLEGNQPISICRVLIVGFDLSLAAPVDWKC